MWVLVPLSRAAYLGAKEPATAKGARLRTSRSPKVYTTRCPGRKLPVNRGIFRMSRHCHTAPADPSGSHGSLVAVNDLHVIADRIVAEFPGTSMDDFVALVQQACGFSQESLDGAYDAVCVAQDRANGFSSRHIALGRELRAQHASPTLTKAVPVTAPKRTPPRAITGRESRSRRVTSANRSTGSPAARPRPSDDDPPLALRALGRAILAHIRRIAANEIDRGAQ